MKNLKIIIIAVIILVTGGYFMMQRDQEIPADAPPPYPAESNGGDYIKTYPDQPVPNQPVSAVSEFNCQINEPLFADYPRFFEDKDYNAWCEECIENNGKPQVSYDAGPFCNLKTSDAGRICTDSEQCGGYCIAEDTNSNSGKCTEYQQLGDGCGWLEVINGEVAELCVS